MRKGRWRDAPTKVVQRLPSVLELARELGNVAEARWRRGMDWTSFYEWTRCFQALRLRGGGGSGADPREPPAADELSAERVASVEKMNPCFREGHVESSATGGLLSLDTFFVLHAVVDTYGPDALGLSHTSPNSPRWPWLCCMVGQSLLVEGTTGWKGTNA